MHPYREGAIPDPEPTYSIVKFWQNGDKWFNAIVKSEGRFTKVEHSDDWVRDSYWRFSKSETKCPRALRRLLVAKHQEYLAKVNEDWMPSEEAAVSNG